MTERLLRFVCVIVALSVLVAPACEAQSSGSQLITSITRDDGSVVDLRPAPKGFSLFADNDEAGTSLKLKGGYRYVSFNAGGLCAYANTSGDLFNSTCGQAFGTSFFFHVQTVWGAPPSAYNRIKAVWPKVAMMKAPVGYSTPWRITSIFPLTLRIGPADNQFGEHFSGVLPSTDGSCRDMSGTAGAGMPSQMPLAAKSDCPETWGSAGFDGIHVVSDSVWLNAFQAQGGAFRWDDWRVPPSSTAPLLGDASTYGAFSDYNAAAIASYGLLTPLGNQEQQPLERGFPLGIEVRYDAFRFDRALLRDGAFIRWKVVNNSAKVYGAPIDYDSLYMGIDPGFINAWEVYNLPAFGANIFSGGNTSGRCNNTTFPKRLLSAGGGCAGFSYAGNQRQHLIMVLKSPIGDLRNKQFSNPASPFFMPTHPKADDTITFNHWRRGGFGAQEQFSWRRSDRSLFGLLSGDEDLWLDGRSYADFSAANIWTYFRYEFSTGTQSRENLRYTRSVPGSIPSYGKWDYNDDGIQDTLLLPDCGSKGCAGLWGDSSAGGWPNTTVGNIGNYLGVGPFSLKAGDTTEFIWFMGGAPDTTQMRALLNRVTSAYIQNFPLGQPAIPLVTASDVQVTAAELGDTTQRTQITFRLHMPEQMDDQYLTDVVRQLQANTPVANELRRLNPGLIAKVQSRARVNLAKVLVFKSCDQGRTWTPGGCESAATARTTNTSGSATGFGWIAFRELRVDTLTGLLPTYTITDIVEPGRSYLYSFASMSRGLLDIPVVYGQVTDAAGNVTAQKIGTLLDAMFIDVDTVVAPLLSTGSSTLAVYAPVSVPAGTIVARIDTVTAQGMATNRTRTTVRSSNITGTYRMRFGNRFIITRALDTLTRAKSTTVVRQSLYTAAIAAGLGIPLTNYVAAADTFTATHDISLGANIVLSVVPRFTTGSVQTFVDTITAPGYVVSKTGGTSEPLYLATATSLSPTFTNLTQATSAYEGASWYPGFAIVVNPEIANPNARRQVVFNQRGDSIRKSLIDSSGVIYLATTTTGNPSGLRSSPGGRYVLEWDDDAFGPGAPFLWEHPEPFTAAVKASLDARKVATTTDTAQTSRQLIISGQNNVGALRPLIQARLPFRIRGINGDYATPVMVQRHVPGSSDSAFRNSRLLGTRGDTVRIPVPPDLWLPGDTLYVIENVVADSTVTTVNGTIPVVRDTVINGRTQTLPIQVVRRVYGGWFVFGCNASGLVPSRQTCNPIRPGIGATTYAAYKAGYETVLEFNRPFNQNSEIAITALPAAPGGQGITTRDLESVHAVPNPYIVQSAFDTPNAAGTGDAKLLFVNAPKAGTLRIYTISGQLVRQLTWSEADLVAQGDNSLHGDLPFNLKNASGRDLGSGLYLFIIDALDTNSKRITARGKFVIIR